MQALEPLEHRQLLIATDLPTKCRDCLVIGAHCHQSRQYAATRQVWFRGVGYGLPLEEKRVYALDRLGVVACRLCRDARTDYGTVVLV